MCTAFAVGKLIYMIIINQEIYNQENGLNNKYCVSVDKIYNINRNTEKYMCDLKKITCIPTTQRYPGLTFWGYCFLSLCIHLTNLEHTHYAVVFFFFLSICLFIYLFMAVLGLHFYARAFSSCGKQGPLFIAVRGPLTIAASLVAEHRLQTGRLSNCGSRA